ncbi:diacylglycerol kinase [Volvox carteri f. nagariensis]|uniref:Diacylglycerol kinase n=1 Tax=Volvox carteri f. nagariensis TaxID=3068 RepID=D8TM94_VOLCA|nr:diacylglycerol kinase [Volvox carteri f. nagariensis]EFJ51464.1 diacylglycerol kinase [Volvox carteri f. nagariensis]|eukprot:XP_002947416.1 diacylglycerol kinase [Volvox carteri f. nagariensis]
MKASQADPEEAQGSWSLNVRCGAATGTIHLKDDGMFSFTPDPTHGGGYHEQRRVANTQANCENKGRRTRRANARPHRSPIGWLFRLLRRPVQHQVIPADQLLGARLESPCTLTVWFATPHTARMGCVTKHLFRVRQTPRFEASDPLAASELVARVRRAASWWGRDTPPHVAAIINPKAGRGGAAGLFHGRLLPLLRDVAGLRVSERLTEAAGHASALVRELALNVAGGGVGGGGDGGDEGGVGGGAGDVPAADGVDLIMFVGGDGTLHEGLQGLFQRPDWESARGIPLVAIPCGSGNGVAASCGLWDVPTAVVAVCRGQVAPVDVASVLQPPDNRYYCLLSVVYGAMLPCLPTRLPDSPSSLPGGWQQLADSFAIFGAYNTQYVALGARANPGGLMADGAWEVWQLAAQGRRAGAGLRLRSLKVLLGVEDGSFAKAAGVMHVTKARALLFQQRDDSTWTVLDGEAVREAPLYLEVHPRLCRLLVSPVFREEPL